MPDFSGEQVSHSNVDCVFLPSYTKRKQFYRFAILGQVRIKHGGDFFFTQIDGRGGCVPRLFDTLKLIPAAI